MLQDTLRLLPEQIWADVDHAKPHAQNALRTGLALTVLKDSGLKMVNVLLALSDAKNVMPLLARNVALIARFLTGLAFQNANCQLMTVLMDPLSFVKLNASLGILATRLPTDATLTYRATLLEIVLDVHSAMGLPNFRTPLLLENALNVQ